MIELSYSNSPFLEIKNKYSCAYLMCWIYLNKTIAVFSLYTEHIVTILDRVRLCFILFAKYQLGLEWEVGEIV